MKFIFGSSITNKQYMWNFAVSGALLAAAGVLLMLWNGKRALLIIATVIMVIAVGILAFTSLCRREMTDDRIEDEIFRSKATALDLLLFFMVFLFCIFCPMDTSQARVLNQSAGMVLCSLLFVVSGFSVMLTGAKYLIIEWHLRAGIELEEQEEADEDH